MTGTQTTEQRSGRWEVSRLLLAAAVVFGVFAMHGLTTPARPMSMQQMSGTAVMAHSVEHIALSISESIAHSVSALADSEMPMTVGHSGHDVMDLCLAILVGLAALTLLAAARNRRRRRTLSGRTATHLQYYKLRRTSRRLAASATTLCVSRT